MTVKRIKYLLIATFIVVFSTYSLWSVIKETYGVRVFYPGTALSFVGFTYVIHQLIKKIDVSNYEKRWFLVLSNIIYLTSLNNLLDEVFFNPTVININEYMGFIVIILVTIYNYKNYGRNDSN